MATMKLRALILFLLSAFSFQLFGATNYYVSPTGSSGNTASESSPWPLQFALDRLNPGVTVILKPGVYSGPGYFAIDGTGGNMSGHPTNLATIRSQYKWQAVLANSTNQGFIVFGCTNVVVDGLCISNSTKEGFKMTGAFNTVSNCWIVHSGEIGYSASNPGNSNIVVDRCLIELSGHGVWDGTNGHRWHATYLVGPNLTFRNSVVRHNAGQGIAFGTADSGPFMNNFRAYNNLTYGHTNFTGMAVDGAEMESEPIGLNPGTNYVYGNTILDSLHISLGTIYITNNIILPAANRPTDPIDLNNSDAPIQAYLDNNLSTMRLINPDDIFDNGSVITIGANSVTNTYMGFVNTNSGLYWLKSDSPARGSAKTNVFGPVNFFGNAQSSVSDIGAFQYTAALAGDQRDLSPANGANYWLVLGGGSMTVNTSRITNLRIVPQ